ncbi:hypothetical protein A9Q96_16865 [Rhodobacterales bacterium 52_120_T64]|nr:hypothetical protein A9Q96_16865 [Rhodobacterales bacterium 52_120_T64]
MSYSKDMLLVEIFEIQILGFFNRIGRKQTRSLRAGKRHLLQMRNDTHGLPKADIDSKLG